MLNKLGPRRYRGLKKSKIFIRDNTSEVIIGNPHVPMGHAQELHMTIVERGQPNSTKKEKKEYLLYVNRCKVSWLCFDIQEVKSEIRTLSHL